MQLYYAKEASQEGFSFDETESKHLVRVLRHQAGDDLLVTDGRGGKYICQISDSNPKRVSVQVLNHEQLEPRAAKLTLAIAPTKQMDRMEWLVEKATEIGVDRIIPMVCRHSERKTVKTQRLIKIATSAMKQSLKFYLPEISELVPLNQVLEHAHSKGRFICHLPKGESPVPLKEQLEAGEDAIVLIGPEGDFSSEEIQQALSRGFSMATLGKSRLRTETAALAAVFTFAQSNPS